MPLLEIWGNHQGIKKELFNSEHIYPNARHYTSVNFGRRILFSPANPLSFKRGWPSLFTQEVYSYGVVIRKSTEKEKRELINAVKQYLKNQISKTLSSKSSSQ